MRKFCIALYFSKIDVESLKWSAMGASAVNEGCAHFDLIIFEAHMNTL